SLRSVDSEAVGRVIEPRNRPMVGADAVEPAEGSTEARKRPSAEVPPGSESTARVQRRSPGTWEALSSPPEVERPHAERDERAGGGTAPRANASAAGRRQGVGARQ